MRILIIEDEVIIAFHLEAALLEDGHRVVGFARDSRSAAVLAHDKHPDLALVDVNLADGQTGPEIARHLTGMSILVVFMTANVELLPDDFAGALGVIAKPIPEHVLRDAVHYAEARRRGERPDKPPRGLIVRRQPTVWRPGP